jgi:hypothetical protein
MNTPRKPLDLASLSDRLDVVDALYRFGAGQDLHDEALFASAFDDDDAALDFVQPARLLGVELPVFRGKLHIVGSIMAAVARLDTTHTVTNPRVQLDGDAAELFALVEAQHLPHDDHCRHLLLKNIYRVRLRRHDQGWRIRHLHIHTVWKTGDARVLFP